jgi:transmembrane sensor
MHLRSQIKNLAGLPVPSGEEVRARFTPMCSEAGHSASETGHWGLARKTLNVAMILATACAASVIALVVYRIVWIPGGLAWDSSEVYTTEAGQQLDFKLLDGSLITLAGGSSVRFTLTPTRRFAFLDRGEARFRVQHDAWRPFTVFAGLGAITAVGTVFDVRRYSDRVFVTCSEGAVEVAPDSVSGPTAPIQARSSGTSVAPARLRLARDEEVTYNSLGEVAAPHAVDAHLSSSWSQGVLIYQGRPLREVIEDVQRYSARRILVDAGAADLLYTGTFIERDVERWLRGLPRIFPVDVIDSAPSVVTIRFKLAPQQEARSDSVGSRLRAR